MASRRSLRALLVGLLCLFWLLPISALANHNPQDAFDLTNDVRQLDTLPAGGASGKFAFYRFVHPGGKASVSVNLLVSPDDGALLNNVGFNISNQTGALVVKGGPRQGLNPNVSADVYSDTRTTFLVPVYNYDPGRGNQFEIWATGLPAPSGGAEPSPAPEMGWKTFSSAATGVRVDVPESWNVRETADAIELAQPDNAQWARITWRDFGHQASRDELVAYGRSILDARYGDQLIVNETTDFFDGVEFNIDFKDRPQATGHMSVLAHGNRAFAYLVDQPKDATVWEHIDQTVTLPWNVPAGTVLAQEDFSSTRIDWSRDSDQFQATGAADGAFRYLFRQGLRETNTGILVNAGPDVSLEMDVVQSRGVPGSTAYFACRVKDFNNQYQLYVQPGGAVYGIGKSKGGEFERLVRGTAPETIKPIGELNHVRADCVGDTLTFTVNGKQPAQVKDPDFQIGHVRFGADTPENGAGTIFQFDNLVVKKG